MAKLQVDIAVGSRFHAFDLARESADLTPNARPALLQSFDAIAVTHCRRHDRLLTHAAA